MNASQIFAAAEKNADFMKGVLDHIWAEPETGYRETKTSAYLAGIFRDLGYEVREAGDIPGFTAELDTGRPGPTIAAIFELDALIVPEHPEAVDGKVHACGHHAQCAAGVGVAATFKKSPDLLDGLSGKIRFIAVPAEELIEFEYRHKLRREGRIKYFGGKVEFLRRGMFDGCDVAFMVHAQNDPVHLLSCFKGANGCITKEIEYHGRAAHAGGAPDKGRNALYAAMIGMQAINSLRETFKDDDHIRVHPIMTNGGESVNIIPNYVKLSTYVRGASDESMREANRKVTRALAAGAVAMGVSLRVQDLYGYSPLVNDPYFAEKAGRVLKDVYGEDKIDFNDRWRRSSTDMSAVAIVMPSINWYASGSKGTGHGSDYYIADPDISVVNSAKSQIIILTYLLENGAAEARDIMSHFRPKFKSIKEFLASVDEIDFEGDIVTVDDDENITLH